MWHFYEYKKMESQLLLVILPFDVFVSLTSKNNVSRFLTGEMRRRCLCCLYTVYKNSKMVSITSYFSLVERSVCDCDWAHR